MQKVLSHLSPNKKGLVGWWGENGKVLSHLSPTRNTFKKWWGKGGFGGGGGGKIEFIGIFPFINF